uniref:Uncharacterized protein n=1 Tax=Panagrolaimus superbus TaxID=310955 RepID=A0A914YMF2_9BILA
MGQQPGALGQQPGALGQQMNNGVGSAGQQPLGPAGIPIVGNAQGGNMQNPNQPQQQPFGSNLGLNSMQQQPGMNPSLQG